MVYLLLLCLLAVMAGAGRELILNQARKDAFSVKTFLRSPSLWGAIAFIGVGTLGLVTVLFWDVKAVLALTTFRFLCGLGVLVLLFCVSLLFGLGHKSQKWGVLAICFLLVTMLVEGVFNFRYFQTAEFEPVNLIDYMTQSSGAQVEVEGATQLLPNGKLGKVYEDKAPTEPGRYKLKDKKLVMEFTDLNVELDNLWIGVSAPGKNNEGEKVKVSLKATDEGNELYYSLKGREVEPRDGTTRWIALDTAGVSEKLHMTLEIEQSELDIVGIQANTPKPLRISIIRMIIVFLVVFGLYAVRPGSSLYRRKLNSNSTKQMAVIMATIILNLALAFTIIACGNKFLNLISRQHDQYQKLAGQLAIGEVTYPEEVPEFLLEMENPYDLNARKEASAKAGEGYMWDVALYEGKYYVYFGITPVILFYLPFYLCTGKAALPNDIVVFLGVAMFISGVFLLVYRFLKRKYPDVPFLLYLLLSLLVANGSGIYNLLIYPSMYCVPIAVGLGLTVWGLALWLGALEKPKLSGFQLVLGSLCMALVAGCRPQMLLWSFLAIPLFYSAFVKEKTLLPTSKNGVAKLACFAVPYIVVAAGLMYYNAIRFGSPFDFGANYNLTTNDMTVRGFQMGRIGPALYMYLLQFPKATSNYPFLRFGDFDSTYMGTTIRETTYGGLFATSPFVLLGLVAFNFRKWLKENKLFGVTVFLLLSGIVVAVMDGQMAGILQRYFSDFSLFFVLAAAIVFVTLYQRAGQVGRKCLTVFLVATMVWTAVYSATLVFAASSLSMPVWLKTAIQFWM